MSFLIKRDPYWGEGGGGLGRISIFNGAHCLLIESICLGNGGRDPWIGLGGEWGGGQRELK